MYLSLEATLLEDTAKVLHYMQNGITELFMAKVLACKETGIGFHDRR